MSDTNLSREVDNEELSCISTEKHKKLLFPKT